MLTKQTDGIGKYLHKLNEKRYWCRQPLKINQADDEAYEEYADIIITDDILDYYYGNDNDYDPNEWDLWWEEYKNGKTQDTIY